MLSKPCTLVPTLTHTRRSCRTSSATSRSSSRLASTTTRRGTRRPLSRSEVSTAKLKTAKASERFSVTDFGLRSGARSPLITDASPGSTGKKIDLVAIADDEAPGLPDANSAARGTSTGAGAENHSPESQLRLTQGMNDVKQSFTTGSSSIDRVVCGSKRT